MEIIKQQDLVFKKPFSQKVHLETGGGGGGVVLSYVQVNTVIKWLKQLEVTMVQ